MLIYNSNSTEWRPIRSVIVRVIDKIGRPRSGILISWSWVWLKTELDDTKLFYQLIKTMTKLEKENRHHSYVFTKKNSIKCALTGRAYDAYCPPTSRHDVSNVLLHCAITSMTCTPITHVWLAENECIFHVTWVQRQKCNRVQITNSVRAAKISSVFM